MASFNKIILAGNLTKDPEIRDARARGGKEFSVCDFTLAVNRRGKNATQDADYFQVAAYNDLGEALAEYKGKGDAVLVEGMGQYQEWEDRQTGDKRSKIVVAAQSIQYLDSAGRGVNKVFLAGNLTRNPEMRYTGGGVQVASFGLAVNRVRGAAEGVDFFDVSAFDDLAGIVSEHKVKGDGVIVEGRLKYDLWDDRETGDKRSKVSVVAQNVEFTFMKDGAGGREKATTRASGSSHRTARGPRGTRPAAGNGSRGGSRKGGRRDRARG